MKKTLILIGMCIALISCKIEGCTDPLATNYDLSADKNDGSCVYEPNSVYIFNVISSPTASEQVTLKNNSGSQVDLSGWTIGDSNNPNAYSIPIGTSVAQGATVTKNGSTMGFQINDSGETIYLKNSSGSTIDTWNN